jgi:hypothetical protein
MDFDKVLKERVFRTLRRNGCCDEYLGLLGVEAVMYCLAGDTEEMLVVSGRLMSAEEAVENLRLRGVLAWAERESLKDDGEDDYPLDGNFN